MGGKLPVYKTCVGYVTSPSPFVSIVILSLPNSTIALTEVAPHPLTLQQVELNSHAFGVWQQETLHECKVSFCFFFFLK